jgi:hypothetical protein
MQHTIVRAMGTMVRAACEESIKKVVRDAVSL